MSVHTKWLESLKDFDHSLQLPPPSLKELNLEYIEIRPSEFMKAKLPFQDKFTNPTGSFQGGFLSAAMDEVFGPLAYLSFKTPGLSLNLNLTFLRPFIKSDEFCYLEAHVISMTNNFIFMRGEIKNQDRKLIAHAESHMTKAKS
jgi:uncharacterized protein (TIGR00369 family)